MGRRKPLIYGWENSPMTISNEVQVLDDSQETQHYVEEVDDQEDGDSYPIDQYDLVTSPNDFNTRTLIDFIESGVISIPGFQRNFVWDLKRASRLIESMIVGLPVPQIFLYETGSNQHLVIDGQQRLMSIYYFVKERFPRREKLAELRSIASGRSAVQDYVIEDEQYFGNFRLSLPESASGQPNRLHGQLYSSLDEEHRSRLDLRTIRHIIVRQIKPSGDHAMYEIFNRLNSGGVNLTPQEIRRCAFDSKFYDLLYETNAKEEWRTLVGTKVPDIHMKDVEILLRGFAMLVKGNEYRPSMVKFLNQFSLDAKVFDSKQLEQFRMLLNSFLVSCKGLPSSAFHSTAGRFSPMIFESVFVAACAEPYQTGQVVKGMIDAASLDNLKEDGEFRGATQYETARTANVRMRLSRAKALLRLT